MAYIPSKQQELEILDRTIYKLGEHSYLASWLTQVKAEITRDITSDIYPTATLAEAREQAAAIVRAAQVEAQAILDRAQKVTAEHVRVAALAVRSTQSAILTVQRDLQAAENRLASYGS